MQGMSVLLSDISQHAVVGHQQSYSKTLTVHTRGMQKGGWK
jgi:hypothetical protein